MAGFRFGMTIARPKRRAVCATTEAGAGPSRRWRCQSSGFASVRRSMAAILLPARCGSCERLAIELVSRRAGDLGGKLRGVARRELRHEARKHLLGVDGRRALEGDAGGEDQHELALLAARGGIEPGPRLAERQPRHLLELLRELAADHDLAGRSEPALEIRARLANAVRRFVKEDRRRADARASR